MNKLNDVKLQSILPASIAGDVAVLDICTAIDEALRRLSAQSELVLLLPRLDELPERIVDELAWQYHVDFYDHAAMLTKKRDLVRQAIAWHKRKGTPAAVEEVCAAVFKTARVYENWEYGGEPYHFQVRLIEEGIPNQAVVDNLHRAIKETKNTRSWLDGLSFSREVSAAIKVGGAYSAMRKIEVYPARIKPQELTIKTYCGSAMWLHKGVDVTCQTGQI